MESVRTIQYIRELKAGGATQEQAEAQVIALENALTDLATKSDLKTEIQLLRTEFNSRFDKIDSRFDKIDSRFDKMATLGWAIFTLYGITATAFITVAAKLIKP